MLTTVTFCVGLGVEKAVAASVEAPCSESRDVCASTWLRSSRWSWASVLWWAWHGFCGGCYTHYVMGTTQVLWCYMGSVMAWHPLCGGITRSLWCPLHRQCYTDPGLVRLGNSRKRGHLKLRKEHGDIFRRTWYSKWDESMIIEKRCFPWSFWYH